MDSSAERLYGEDCSNVSAEMVSKNDPLRDILNNMLRMHTNQDNETFAGSSHRKEKVKI